VRRAVMATILLSVLPVLGVWARGQPSLPAVVPDGPLSPVDAINAVTALTDDGVRLFESKDFVEACRRFSAALEHEPDSDVLRRNVTRCFAEWGWDALRAGDADQAIRHFRQGLRRTPQGAELLTGLGVAAVQAGRLDMAIPALEGAIRTRPDSELRLLLARLYDQRDDPEQAVVHLRRLIVASPDHSEARRLLDKLEREQAVETGLRKQESAHFILKEPLDRAVGGLSGLAFVLEELYAEIGSRLGHQAREQIVVIVYPERGFREVTRSHAWVSGLFDGKIRLPEAVLAEPADRLRRLLAHELTHAVVHHVARGHAPRWLQEGLAQHFEGTLDDNVVDLPRGLSLAGLDALLTDADEAKARTGYRAALWLCRELIDRGGLRSITALLRRLGDAEPVAASIAAVYGGTLTDLEAEWRRILGG